MIICIAGCILLILLQFVPHQTLSRFQVNQELNQEREQEQHQELNQEINQEQHQELNQELNQDLNQELNRKLNTKEDGAKILLKNGGGVLNERLKVDSGVSCQDEKGNPVDWWIAYKLPQSVNF